MRLSLWARGNYYAFRLGYITALDDIVRTGLQPMTDQAKNKACDRAIRRLFDL